MQQNHTKYQQFLHYINALQAKAPQKTIYKAGLDLLESKTVYRIARNDTVAQAPLLYRLQILQYHQQAAKEIIDDFSG